MRLVIGVDEAGYGPNMGPLVIAVCAWVIESELDVLDGLAPFAPEFQAAPWTSNSSFVPLGDSKKIYLPGKGLSGLSFVIRFFESTLEKPSTSDRPWFALQHLAQDDIQRVESLAWYDRRWSIVERSDEDVLSESTLLFGHEKLVRLGVRLADFRVRILDEAYFNDAVERLGNKADVLGQTSLQLVWQVLRGVVDRYPFKSIEIYCDRQGGRKRYASLLSHTLESSFPNKPVPFVSVGSETTEASNYALTYGGLPLGVRFQVQGDSLFPPAASSLVAKWVRESLMLRLNRYWQGVVGPTLRPTAGYAVDAARFANEIAPWVSKLALEKNHWWRQR